MFQDKLYTVRSFTVSETKDKVSAQVQLNSRHPVFGGHFPGNPILPGVCTVQIIKELLEKAMEQSLIHTKASNIKYLGFISPVTSPLLQIDLTITPAEQIVCSAAVSANGSVVCSFKGEFNTI
jgi:3-hydroxyacyl-[acyl-carrier-protein] dehydratase